MLFFVVFIGFGVVVGIMIIIIDMIGFCGCFFVEVIEDVDKEL